MLLFVKIGFRNLFRNKRASILTSFIIGLGLASMIITDGFLNGMSENMIHTVTSGLVAEGQIHHPKFKEEMKSEYQVENLSQVTMILSEEKEVLAFAKRVITLGMVSSPKEAKNVTLYGIDPKNENKVTTLYKEMAQGRFVEDEKSLVIGSLLQKRLEVEVGDKVIITVAKSGNGEISQEMLRVTGIIKTGMREMDEQMAFIHLKKVQKMVVMGENVSEIALKFHHREIAENPHFPLWKRLKETGNSAQNWKEVASSLVGMMEMTDTSKGIMILILMFLVGLGIINTLFMALYERMFEFAVLKALGTKAHEIVLMIISEAASLSLLSIVAGFIIAIIVAIPMKTIGIDYGGLEFAEVSFREPIYYISSWYQWTLFPLMTLLFTIGVGFYPAIYAARIKMASALKKGF